MILFKIQCTLHAKVHTSSYSTLCTVHCTLQVKVHSAHWKLHGTLHATAHTARYSEHCNLQYTLHVTVPIATTGPGGSSDDWRPAQQEHHRGGLAADQVSVTFLLSPAFSCSLLLAPCSFSDARRNRRRRHPTRGATRRRRATRRAVSAISARSSHGMWAMCR